MVTFKEEKAESLLQKIKLAIKDWNQGHVYPTMQKNALMKDCSWGNAAKNIRKSMNGVLKTGSCPSQQINQLKKS